MAAHEHLQGQLFDPASTRPRDKGEVPFHEWLDQPGVAYHGTLNPSWQEAPYHHFGDKAAATDRLRTATNIVKAGPTNREAYYSGTQLDHDSFDPGDIYAEPEDHVGHVHARKLDLLKQHRKLSDPVANAAHMHAMLNEGYETWEVPQSVAESTKGLVSQDWSQNNGGTPRAIGSEKGKIKAASRALQMGKGITYNNPHEPGETQVSHVAPRAAQSTWEEDVITSKHASPMAQQYARDRISRGEASTVPFEPASNHPGYEALWQGTLHGDGSGHSVKLPRQHISRIQFQTKD